MQISKILLYFFLLFLTASCAPDHFLRYQDDVQEEPVSVEVVLEDQFRKVKAKVGVLEHFFNPVQKTKWMGERQNHLVTKIKNKDHHLISYEITTKEMRPRKVKVKNQFSKKWQRLEVRQPKYLLVPTQKIRPNDHPFPKKLSHYECYEVKGEELKIRVALQDQFRKYDFMPTGNPVCLCNPVKKTHGDRVSRVYKKKWHLVGYELKAEMEQHIPVLGGNQFGQPSMRVREVDLILVPSRKRHIN